MVARPAARTSGARGARRGRRGARAHGAEHEGGAERWLVTYADMLTLLLVLFIVLFSISVVNTSKFITLRTSLASAFGSGQKSVLDGGNGLNSNDAEGKGQQLVMPGVPVLPSTVPVPSAAQNAPDSLPSAPDDRTRLTKELNDFARIQREISQALAQRGMSGAVRFAVDRRGLVITVITNDIVFHGNSADLLTGGQRILAVIAPPLCTVANGIEVDGYTNQVNVSTAPYPTGWELSSARASAVVRYLISQGVGEGRLSAVGYSDQHPLYPPSDPRAVTLNRRVEVVVRSSLPSDLANQLPAAAAAAGTSGSR